MQQINQKMMERVMSRVSFAPKQNSGKFNETSRLDEVDGSDDKTSKFDNVVDTDVVKNDLSDNIKLEKTISEDHPGDDYYYMLGLEDAVNKMKTELDKNEEQGVGEVTNKSNESDRVKSEPEISAKPHFGMNDDQIKEFEPSEGNKCSYESVDSEGEIADTVKPRIVMFDDSESNESNPFVISSFQSLNVPDDDTNSAESTPNSDSEGAEIEDFIDNDKISCTDYVNEINDENGEMSGDNSCGSDKPYGNQLNESDGTSRIKAVGNDRKTDMKNTNEGFDVYRENAETGTPKSSHFKTLSERTLDSKSDIETPDDFKEIKESLTHGSNTADSRSTGGEDEKEIEKEMVVGIKKSRKQNIPKRIIRDAEEFVVTKNAHLDKDSNSQNKTEKSRKQYKPNRILENVESDEINMKEDEASSDIMDTEAKVKDEVIDYAYEEQSCVETENNSNCDADTVNESVQHNVQETDSNHIPHSQSSSFYLGLAPDLRFYPNVLSDQLLKPNTSKNFALDENGPANLEVIRQLREIRCNRYRKISMAEKREIARYASAHGVSQAASFFNVSKSAVSMWTKLDFSQVDDGSGKSKKNCMIGNEKFEALCRKVKTDRETKFKNMTKQDKFEVSRYAKLVGVREMARCLDVALGTVSGWMRQFPYKVETKSSNERNADDTDDETKESEMCGNSAENETAESKTGKIEAKGKTKKRISNKRKTNNSIEETDDLIESYETIQEGNTMYILPTSEIDNDTDISPLKKLKLDACVEDSDSNISFQQNDEVDQLIAETLQKPDAAKCFDDVKEMIKDSPLENDDFFRALFDRVIACRADKYKSLKPSEKLEVVRYAKRVGVRRIAKILGLATGTLSGWNTKFQSSLGLTDPSIDNPVKPDLLVSYLSTNGNVSNDGTDSSNSSTPGSVLDNTEKTEVTAVKLLFKDNYPVMLKKIEVAKQMKFRNISKDEKIEFVKCSKLVGIRPTARVFGIPIGTLSGWITKYSKILHPAYHVEGDVNVPDNILTSDPVGTNLPLLVGRNPELNASLPVLHSGMGNNSGWANVPSITSLASGSLVSTSSSQHSRTRNPNMTYGDVGLNTSTLTGSSFLQGENRTKQSICSMEGNQSKNENWSNLNARVKQEPIKTKNHSTSVAMTTEEFDEEAKLMAEKYLKTVYQQIGLSNS